MGGMSGKGGGGFMPNPVTGLPRNATPGGGGFGGFQPGMGYAGGNPNFSEMQPNRMGSPNSPPTMPNPGFGPTDDMRTPMTNDRGFLGGNPGFSERMDAGPAVMPQLGAGGANPQVIGSMLKAQRWDGNGMLPNQPGVPDAPPMGSAPPGGNAGGGVPGMSPGNFGPTGQSGNSQDAIYEALATGNQAGLSGQGSQATNSDINGAFGSKGASDYYAANRLRLNRQGPLYQPGGIFYNR